MPGFERFKTESVFTPASIPEQTFVERSGASDRLVTHLRTKARPICVSGPFRCGKTTLVMTKVQQLFERHVHVVCKRDTTFADLLLQAFDALSPYYSQEVQDKSTKVPAGVSADFFGIKGQLGGKGTEQTAKQIRVLPPQLTSRALATFAAAADAPWIVDDAHKINSDELSKVAEAMREWQTIVLDVGSPKMVVIGSEVLDERFADRLIDAAPDLRQRLVDIPLDIMSEQELANIVERGGESLNVDFGSFAKAIINYSSGFPGVCQDLCFHVCDAAGVMETADVTVVIQPEHLEKALNEYLATCSPRIGRTFRKLLLDQNSGLPQSFSKVTLDKIASMELKGMPLDQLTQFLTESLNLSESDILNNLRVLLNDNDGVLRCEGDQGVIQFVEPLYLVYYRQYSAQKNQDIPRHNLLAKFLEIMRKR